MEETTPTPQPQKKDNAIIFYILGGLIITAIIVAGFILMPKGTTETPQQPVLGETVVVPTAAPTAPGPITALSCTDQFYNTVNGVPENYYLTTAGESPTAAGQVTCTLTATLANNEVLATQVVTPTMSANTERGGNTFRCTTQGLKLRANVPVKVTTELRDANGNVSNCNRTFLLP